MNFVGIDIAAERHVFAALAGDGSVRVRPTPFGEDAQGYATLLKALERPRPVLVVMEATGHYWKNLFAVLAAAGHDVALINPLRTRRFQGEDSQRTKTDALDSLGLAHFGLQKRPPATRIGEAAIEDLRELVRHRDRLKQDFDDRVRQLHRLVDLGFPEFTRHVRSLDSMLAAAILAEYPTARALAEARRHAASPSCATTAGVPSAPSSPTASSRPPGARSASTTARPTASRCAISVRTSTSGAGASRSARATSSASRPSTRSARS